MNPYRAGARPSPTPARRTYTQLRARVSKHGPYLLVYAGLAILAWRFLHHCVPIAIEIETENKSRVEAHERDCEQFRNTPQRDIPGRCLSYYLPSR